MQRSSRHSEHTATGRLPEELRLPGRSVPYFVDRKTGVLCAVGTTIWNVAANRDGRMPFASYVGVLSGVTSIALGVGAAAQDATPELVAITNFGVGALSSVVAASGLMRRQHLSAARRAAERRRDTGEKSGIEMTVTPTFSATQKAAGVMVQLRF